MSFDLRVSCAGIGGLVAVKPSAVVLAINAGTGCELLLVSGATISLTEDAQTIAKRLWGEINKMPSGYFNSEHVLAVTPHPEGARIIFSNNTTLDMAMPSDTLIVSLSGLDETRSGINLSSSTPGKI